jgi:hypothetical protein
MSPTEITALLAICASADNRKPNPEMVQFWTAALGDLDFHPCRDAVVAHYQDSTDWIMPAHIRGRVRRARAAAISHDEALELPPHDPDDTALHVQLLTQSRQRAVYQPPAAHRAVGEMNRAERDAEAKAALARITVRARELRAELNAGRAEFKATVKPAPEPLLRPEDHSREPAPIVPSDPTPETEGTP